MTHRLLPLCLAALALALALGFTACASRPGARSDSPAFNLRAELDTTIGPGKDFFDYVNARWIAANPIPPDRTDWGVDTQLMLRNLNDLKQMVDALQKDTAATGERKKLRDFFATALDEARLNRDDMRPLDADFTKITKVASIDDLIALTADFHIRGIEPLFSTAIDQDQKQSDRYAFYISQGGTGLPENGYYIKDDPDSQRIRREYQEHVKRMFVLLGDTPEKAAAGAATVLSIETRLAQKHMTPVEQRDPEAQYNKMPAGKLKDLAPRMQWSQYLRAVGGQNAKDVIVRQPEAIKRVNELLQSESIDNWRTYLRWHLIHATAYTLSDRFVDENFAFYATVMRGQTQNRSRWERAMRTIDACMGEALGKVYVETRFPPEAKRRMNEMVDNIVAAYAQRLETRDWMTPVTRAKALTKLKAMGRKLGYPDRWRDYSALEIASDSYVQNVLRSHAFDHHRRMARLDQPIDRAEWEMTPQTVNAYYNPTMNEIVFPAGILQPPFFDLAADDAVNYGATGATVGHELTHGFDDEGCQYDAAGNLANWWTPEDKARFDAHAKKLVKQYNDCVVVDGQRINGELTLGENIADLGGLVIAFEAYKRSLKGKPAPIIDGLTGEQRFFIAYAYSWRGHTRVESLKAMLRSDPHSPPHFRVTMPLTNMKEFVEAFQIKPSDPMYRKPEDRVEIW